MTTTKDIGKDQRVVLNLSLEQAKDLWNWFDADDAAVKGAPHIMKLKNRLQKTITKYQNVVRVTEPYKAESQEIVQ